MPAGTGMYATLALLPFLVSPRRVLISAPNALVRDQLADEFRSLHSLRRGGVCSTEVPSPRVNVVLGVAQRDAMIAADVTVGQASHLMKSDLGSLFDLILVVAGHHWRTQAGRLLERLPIDAQIVIVTSGPPVGDRQYSTPAVATYSLGQAVREGVLAPVRVLLVGQTTDGPDRAIAREAASRLHAEEHAIGGSVLLVRSPAVDLERLRHIYSEMGVRLAPVEAVAGQDSLREALRQIADREADGLFVSSSLGEGVPGRRLAIAAYHREHGLLAETAQILGRTTAVERVQGELVAVASDIEKETGRLYADDSGWLDLLPRLTAAVADGQGDARQFLAGFSVPQLPGVSLAAVRVPKNICVFRVRSSTWGASQMALDIETLARGSIVYNSVDPGARMKIMITEHRYHPPWLDSAALDAPQHELHVVVWNDRQQLLFLATNRSETADEIVDKLDCSEAVRVEAQWIDRLMYSQKLHGYFSVGMRNARGASRRRAAYQMLAGRSVGQAVRASDTQTFATGHLIARAGDILAEGSDRLTAIGCSYAKSRIWSPGYAHVWMFLQWCDRLAGLVEQVSPDDVPPTAPGIALSSPRRLEAFPSLPYAVVLDSTLYESGFAVEVDGVPHDLASLLLAAEADGDTLLNLSAALGETVIWRGVADVRGRVIDRGEGLLVTNAEGEVSSFGELLDAVPPTVFFSDGSCVTGHLCFQPADDLPELDDRTLVGWTFDNVAIRAESKPAPPGRLNVQSYTINRLAETHPNAWILVDDAANEIADIVVVDRVRETGPVRVVLAHCKYSSEDFPGPRVKDLYEVLGQAQRSTRWLGPHLWPELTKRLANRTSTRLVRGKGDDLASALSQWTTTSPRTSYAIHVVQPGQRLGEINTHVAARCLISVARDFVSDYEADFQLFAHTDEDILAGERRVGPT
jgi:hypothetical protein